MSATPQNYRAHLSLRLQQSVESLIVHIQTQNLTSAHSIGMHWCATHQCSWF